MKTLLEIDNSLNKLVEIRHKLIFEIGYPRHIIYTIEEIENAIKIHYDVKNILQNYKIDDAKRIINDKRNSIIQYEKELTEYIRYFKGHYLRYDIKFLNWVLDKDEFDREIN